MPLDAAGGPLRVIMDSSGAVGAEDLSTSGQVRAALMDPECAALVILSDSAFTDKEGVPLDRIDLLWVAGWSGELAKLSARLAILLPQLEGTEVLFDEFLWQAQGGITFPRDAIPLVLSDGAALERVCARLGIEMAQELTF